METFRIAGWHGQEEISSRYQRRQVPQRKIPLSVTTVHLCFQVLVLVFIDQHLFSSAAVFLSSCMLVLLNNKPFNSFVGIWISRPLDLVLYKLCYYSYQFYRNWSFPPSTLCNSGWLLANVRLETKASINNSKPQTSFSQHVDRSEREVSISAECLDFSFTWWQQTRE